MKKKAEEIKRKMAAAAKSSPEDESASQATGSESEPDRGAQMKKKAEEIKRKMAEAAEEKDSASLDKTVVASKPPTQDRGDTEGK